MSIFNNRLITVLAGLGFVLLTGCSEEMDVRTRSMDRSYLVVDAMLTDNADDQQTVLLTESIDYFEDEKPPVVSGARVTVSDGMELYRYTETPPGSGRYVGPEGFHGTPGGTYTLSIDAVVGGMMNHYEAVSTMEEMGFELQAVDYLYLGATMPQADSLWNVALWGLDQPQASAYYISASLNGADFPFGISVILDDRYFNGQQVNCYPIMTISQKEATRRQYGGCGKFLETGDVFTLKIYGVPHEFCDFYAGFVYNGSGSGMPMLQSQPDNVSTNLTGGDALGFFVACSSTSASVVVDNPFRPFYLKAAGGLSK